MNEPRSFCHISTDSANLISCSTLSRRMNMADPAAEDNSVNPGLVIELSLVGGDQEVLDSVVDDPLFDGPLSRSPDRGAVLCGQDGRLDDRRAESVDLLFHRLFRAQLQSRRVPE